MFQKELTEGEGRRRGKKDEFRRKRKKKRGREKWREGKESKLVMDRYLLFF